MYQNPLHAWGTNNSSILGALPYAASPAQQSNDLVTFYFTSFNPDIYNCTVIGPQRRPLYYFVTDRHMPGYTALKDGEGKSIALLEWQNPPLVEMRRLFSKQRAKDWLRLSSDRCSRKMEVAGQRYVWAPQDTSLNLYTGGSTAQFLARITRGQGSVILEISQQALQAGLLEPILVATFVLQCGRNID